MEQPKIIPEVPPSKPGPEIQPVPPVIPQPLPSQPEVIPNNDPPPATPPVEVPKK